MEFKIENGVLEEYSNEENVKSLIIPEGVTKISRDVFINNRESMKIILPKSLKKIENGNFHNTVSYDNSFYEGHTLVLYGVAIDLKEIYYTNHDGYDWTEDFGEELEKQGYIFDPWDDYYYDEDGNEYYLDDDAVKDISSEHQNDLEHKIIDGVIDEINHILSRDFNTYFEYLPSNILHEILSKISIEEPDNTELKKFLEGD